LRKLLLLPAALLYLNALSVQAAFWDFQDGSAAEGNFSATPVRGATNQEIGRVQLFYLGGGSGQINGVSIVLSETRSGLSNFRLWYSIDTTFDGGDVQVGSIATDPGTTTMTISMALTLIGTGSPNFFLTADVSPTASGQVMARVTQWWLGSGSFVSGFGGNDDMSNSNLPLPVTISRFELV
jgi:hypothetical protein